MPGVYKGPCKRGVFALTSWEIPLKRPQVWLEEKKENISWKTGQKLMMKYKYVANENSPLGKELTVKQKDTLMFVSQHDPHWIQVTNETGDTGYVPANYVMVLEEKVNCLPWLDKSSQEVNVRQEAAEFKPYKSAYAPKESQNSGGQGDQSEYFCKVCDKQLNGPIPFRAHMVSKAHKEEMEVAGLC